MFFVTPINVSVGHLHKGNYYKGSGNIDDVIGVDIPTNTFFCILITFWFIASKYILIVRSLETLYTVTLYITKKLFVIIIVCSFTSLAQRMINLRSFNILR